MRLNRAAAVSLNFVRQPVDNVQLFVKFGVDGIEVFTVQIILDNPEGLTKSLEMHDFTLSQVADRINHIRIIYHS